MGHPSPHPRRSLSHLNCGHACEPLERRELLVADPVTVAHPMWFASYGAVVVDGVINDAEWAGSVPITRSQPSRPDASATMRIKYTELGLYVAADVKDQYLWADGTGGGRGPRTDWSNDDALALFFDASVTRKRLMTPAGRALMYSIGPWAGPTNGSGVVARGNYIRGNNPTGIEGDVTGVALHPGGALTPGMVWRTVLHGTANNNADVDQGWTTEVFLPWSTINMPGMPVSGQNITMNFTVMYDDDGGTHNGAEQDANPTAAQRFGPRVIDDQINGVESSFSETDPGMQGPINYAWLTFIDARTTDRPNPVINLAAGSVTGYSARLNFLAPAASSAVMALGTAQRGGVYQYQIRWSDTPITTQAEWNSATEVANAFVPHPRGQADSLRIGGLEPGVTYYFAIRALDIAGRASDIREVSFTTLDETQDTSAGTRVMTSPQGGSLITESGAPYFMVGSEAAPDALYIRNLYPGDIWSASDDAFINYNDTPGAEGDADGYFSSLYYNGVNTLRVPLEQLAPLAPGATAPDGLYWLESPAGNFNLDMRQFLWNMMAQGHQAGIGLILKPFDTAHYKSLFNLTAFAASNGGPLASIDDFFQSAPVISMITTRMTTIIDWIHQSPYASSVIGIELPDAWDSLDWTINPRGNGDPARMQEMRDRSKVILRVAAAVRAYDPDMLLVSGTQDAAPRGAVGRAMLLGDNLDILTPRFSTPSTAEPVNNPDINKSIRPVNDYSALASFWLCSKRDQRVINAQWGFDATLWPGGSAYYTGATPSTPLSKPWTLQNDIDLFRSTTWTQIAMGLGGAGVRIAGPAMEDLLPPNMSPGTTGYMPTPLPQGMRNIQQSAAIFTGDWVLGFDPTSYRPLPLAGCITFTGTTKRLMGVGSSDGEQGMVYVTQDLNRSTGMATGAHLIISGLTTGDLIDVEVWTAGINAQQLDMTLGLQVVAGKLTIALPQFNRDVMVRFKVEQW